MLSEIKLGAATRWSRRLRLYSLALLATVCFHSLVWQPVSVFDFVGLVLVFSVMYVVIAFVGCVMSV